MRAPRPRLSRDAALRLLCEADGGGEAAASWACPVGPLTLHFPNFRWRRRALRAHDLHHLMAGYPKTMRGEFQMAAWEWAAGRYRHGAATAFCMPLILFGLIWSPAAMVRAWRAGRRTRSLYDALTEAPQ